MRLLQEGQCGRMGITAAYYPKVMHDETAQVQLVVEPVIYQAAQSHAVDLSAPQAVVGEVTAHCGAPLAVLAHRHAVHGGDVSEERGAAPWVVLAPAYAYSCPHLGVQSLVQVPSAHSVAHPRHTGHGGVLVRAGWFHGYCLRLVGASDAQCAHALVGLGGTSQTVGQLLRPDA